MREYTVVPKKAYSDPEIGAVNWDSVPAAPIDHVCWNMPAEVRAEGKLVYDEEALYVHLSAEEKDILAKGTKIPEYPNYDSCLEFFFSPMEGDVRYFNFEINPNCLMFTGMGHSGKDLVRFLPETSPFDPEAERTALGWNVSYRIPYSFITLFFPDFKAVPGKTMRGNFYKCGDLCVVPHYYSWNPMTVETPNYHYPPDFGKLIFG